MPLSRGRASPKPQPIVWLREIKPVFEHGQAKVVIDAVLRLEEVGKAHERPDSGHRPGKVILRVEH